MLDIISAGLDPDACWQAVCAHDATFDGRFVFGVRSTGVYCRPSCRSRQPRRENVVFHSTAAEAEEAGFRPCKRCRPNEASAVERHRAAIERACALIRDAETAPALTRLAAEVGMSRHHFHRVFAQIIGTTPGEYARTCRVRRLAAELGTGTPVTEAIYAAGFGSTSRAYEAVPRGLGMSPAAKRKGGAGQTIRYTTARGPIGWVILAASERGICAVAFGDDAESLIAQVRARFPAARLLEDRGELRDWMAALVEYLAAPSAQALNLPLDVQGTAFQARVWRALQKIPPGKTASYAEIAATLGQPNAVRAVARACAGNAIAVLIPCHRVVRSDGGISGYRWGPERKRALLAAEKKAASPLPQAATKATPS